MYQACHRSQTFVLYDYQVLRHIIAEHPLRAQTQKEIDRVQRQIEHISKEGTKFAQMMQVREAIDSVLLLVRLCVSLSPSKCTARSDVQ